MKLAGSNGAVFLVVLIIMLVLLSRFASDIYLPSFPFIAEDFSTSFKWVQFSISGYFIAVSVSQLFYGFLSDRYGRKKLLIFGFILFISGSLLAIVSETIWMFLAARLIQGTGMGASVSLPRAIMSDAFHGDQLLKTSSYVSMSASLGPAIAPILGGYIQYYFNWKTNFIFLLLASCILFIFIFFFHESSPPNKERAVRFRKAIFELLKTKEFVFNFLFSFYMGAILIAYLTDSTFLFQVLLGYNEVQYGHLAIFLVIGFLIGSFANPHVSKIFGMRRSYVVSVFFLFFVSLGFLLVNFIYPLSFYTIIPFITLLSLCAGLISPKALAHAMDSVSRENKGMGAAFMGSAALIGGGISSFIIAHFHYRSAAPLTVLVFIASLAAVGNLFVFRSCYTESR